MNKNKYFLFRFLKTLDWSERGLNINGARLSHLRFADDLILLAEDVEDLQTMVVELHEASLKVGLGTNMSKTKIMCSDPEHAPNVKVGNYTIAVVDQSIYLGYNLSFGRSAQEKEITRRIQLEWAAFGKLEDVLRSPIPQCLKSKVFN